MKSGRDRSQVAPAKRRKRTRHRVPGPIKDNCLPAIRELTAIGFRATTKAIARRLSAKTDSVAKALRRLEMRGLVVRVDNKPRGRYCHPPGPHAVGTWAEPVRLVPPPPPPLD